MKVKLGDIAVLINGDRGKNYPSQNDIVPNGDIPFVNAGHLDGRTICFDEMNYISREKYDRLNSGRFIEGDILYCLRGSLGKKAAVNEGVFGAIASSLVIIRPNREMIDTNYLMFALDSPSIQEQLKRANNGSSQPNLSAASVRAYDIDLPSKENQIQIVERLSMVRAIIDSRQKEIKCLDYLIKARFVEMFGTVHNNVFQFAECTLESISDEFFAGGDKPADCTTERDEAHPYPVFANGYENEGLQGYSTKCRVTQPAVTISARGTIGCCFIREAGFTPVVRLVTIVPNNKVSPVFLKYAIDTMDIKSSGTGQAQLTVPDFKRERIIVPPVELQSQFASFVSQIDKSKAVIQKSLDEAQLLFDSLMQQYFG